MSAFKAYSTPVIIGRTTAVSAKTSSATGLSCVSCLILIVLWVNPPRQTATNAAEGSAVPSPIWTARSTRRTIRSGDKAMFTGLSLPEANDLTGRR